MVDEPRDYERGFTTRVDANARRRLGFDTERGTVTRFVVQLEYELEDEWREVVRYDHDPESEQGHDVTEEGLHMDIYRCGERFDREFVSPPLPVGVALDFAEDHLSGNLQRFIRRFEAWHLNKSR